MRRDLAPLCCAEWGAGLCMAQCQNSSLTAWGFVVSVEKRNEMSIGVLTPLPCEPGGVAIDWGGQA